MRNIICVSVIKGLLIKGLLIKGLLTLCLFLFAFGVSFSQGLFRKDLKKEADTVNLGNRKGKRGKFTHRYFTYNFGALSILNFKDLAVSPRVYTGIFRSNSFGTFKYNEKLEKEFNITLYSSYTSSLGYDIYNGDNKNQIRRGTVSNYTAMHRSKLYRIDKWSDDKNQFMVGPFFRANLLSKSLPDFTNSAVGLDAVLSLMGRVKYIRSFERSNDNVFAKLLVPKRGHMYASLSAGPNIVTFRNVSYAQVSAVTSLTKSGLNNKLQILEGYGFLLDLNYTKYFTEKNHMLTFNTNWNWFDSGGKTEPLVASAISFQVGLMFNID